MPESTSNKKTCLYVDLSNLFGGINDLFDSGVYIDFGTLMPIIDNLFDGVDCFKVYSAYMGLNTAKSEDFDKVRAQNEFINSAKLKGVHFGKGNIRNGQEKGVDMQLGIDMVNDAHLDQFTDFILMSEDADFQYPVSIIKKMGKTFNYCSFANRHSSHFAWEADKKVVLDYNGYFAKGKMLGIKSPADMIIYDIYKDKDVKTKSVKT